MCRHCPARMPSAAERLYGGLPTARPYPSGISCRCRPPAMQPASWRGTLASLPRAGGRAQGHGVHACGARTGALACPITLSLSLAPQLCASCEAQRPTCLARHYWATTAGASKARSSNQAQPTLKPSRAACMPAASPASGEPPGGRPPGRQRAARQPRKAYHCEHAQA